jgi:hypothetical protein
MQSAAMLIGSRKEKKTTETNIDGEVQAPWFRLRIPSLFHRRHDTRRM